MNFTSNLNPESTHPQSKPWLDPELLPPNAPRDSWSVFEDGEFNTCSRENIAARIRSGPGHTKADGEPEHKIPQFVAGPGMPRYVPAPECPEFRTVILVTCRSALDGQCDKSAWFFYPLLTVCLVLVLAGASEYAVLPAVFAVSNGTTHIETWLQLNKLRDDPDRFLAHMAGEMRFQVWLGLQGAKGWSRTLLLCGGWVVVGIVQLLVASGSDGPARNDIAAAALVKAAVAVEPWRLLTAEMMHGSVMHLLMNVAAAASFGMLMEGIANRRLVIPVWLAGALCGSLFSWAVSAKSSVGASGGILALMGFITMMAWRRREQLPPDFFHSFLRSAMWIVILGVLAWEVIDNAAHAGGAFAGALIALAMFANEDRSLPIADSTSLAVIGVAAEIGFVMLGLFTIGKLFGVV